jgi:hypothetical protein
MEKPLVESRVDKLFIGVCMLGFLFFGGFSYCIILPTNGQYDYWDLTATLIAFLFGLPGLLCIAYLICGYKNITVYKSRIELSRLGGFFRQSLHLNDVRGYYIDGEDIVIVTQKQKTHKIRNWFYTNYITIQSELIYKIGRKTVTKPIMLSGKTFIIVLLLIGTGICGYAYYQSNYFTLNPNNLTEITVTLSANPQIQKKSKSNNSRLLLNTKEYPKFTFLVNGIDADYFVSNTTANETIYLTINKNEYEQKLSKETPLTFWMKHNSYNQIGNIYGIRTNNLTYFTPNDYVEATKKDAKWGYVFVVVCALYLIYELQKNKK